MNYMVQINSILGSKTSLKLFRLFASNTNSKYSQTESFKITDISKRSALEWLKVLEANDFLNVEERAGAKFYSLNKDNTIVKQLKILLLLSDMYPKFKAIKTENQIYIFGSASRGEDDEKSDIDVLVIGNERGITQKLKSIDNRIKVSFFTPIEWSKTAKDDKAFFERVEKDKIRLI